MIKQWIIPLLLILSSVGCTRPSPEERQTLIELAGCWKADLASRIDRPSSELYLFSLRPDSSLALTMTYEMGTRSRVWMTDIDVTVSGGNIVWEEHEGTLSRNRDTMSVRKESRGDRSLWRFVRDRSADSIMTRLRASASPPYVYRVPEDRNDGWPGENPSTCGMNEAKIAQLIQRIGNGEHGDIHSVLIAKDGKLIVEEYFAAGGKMHGPFITGLFRDRVHHLASTTKSVTSALVGIAIDQGFIKDAEEPIYRYLPSHASLFSEEKKRIRICDMLTMTPGLEWRQFGVSDQRNDGMQMWSTDDVVRFVLEKPVEAEPGKQFNYSNGTPTVTGAIIQSAVGMGVAEFAEKYLFLPLGIFEYSWTSYPDGSIETDGGLALRPRDLAKIGQLFLNSGLWNGRRIVSEEWIRESTKERLRFGRSARWGYGYHWMQAEAHAGDRLLRYYFVPGDGNQILAVLPQSQMVVVFTAGNYGEDPKPVYHSLIEEFILPAIAPEERRAVPESPF